jgi:tRNA(Ile)-lysidine synthase
MDADVLLGHTLDDQAETVLLGLGRGSGPRSVAGMRARSGRYVRPLLGIPRASTAAACAALGWDPWADPQNCDRKLQRVRLRHEVLPLLEDVLQGGVAESLARTASLLQDDLDTLDALAAAFLDQEQAVLDGKRGLPVAALTQLPRAVRTRVLRGWALELGASEITSVHIAGLEALVSAWHGQRAVDLPGGLRVRRASGTLVSDPPSKGSAAVNKRV